MLFKLTKYTRRKHTIQTSVQGAKEVSTLVSDNRSACGKDCVAKEVSNTIPYLQTAYDTSFRPGDEGCKYPVSNRRSACGRIVW